MESLVTTPAVASLHQTVESPGVATSSGTSPRMRLMAVALPACAAVVGWLAPRSRVATCLALGGGVIAMVMALPLAKAGQRAEMPAAAIRKLPWLSVVVPARDESPVIAALIGDLGRQDHRAEDGSPRFEVTIVDDRSADGTGAVASAALKRAGLETNSRVRRRGRWEPDGKGAALASVPLSDLGGTAIVVLDADARIGVDFLRCAAELIASGAEAVTARRRMLLPVGEGRLGLLLAQVQDDEQTVDGEIQLGRWALGGASELRGNGMVVRGEALAAVGGWNGSALCEDLELSTRLFARGGNGVVWARDLQVWEEPVLGLEAIVRQRVRWAEGLVRRDLRETLPLLTHRGLRPSQRLDVLAWFSLSLTPWAALGLLMARHPGSRRRLAMLAGSYALGTGALTWDALRWSVGLDGLPAPAFHRAGRAIAVVGWSALWLLVLPVGWVRVAIARGKLRFAKTVHRGGREPGLQVRAGVSEDGPPSRASRRQLGTDGAEDRGPRTAEVETEQGNRGGEEVRATRHDQVARLPLRLELALEEREAGIVVEGPDELRAKGQQTLRATSLAGVQAVERRKAERQLADPLDTETLDRGNEAGLDRAGNGAREAPDDVEHPAAVVRGGGTQHDERDD